jgi:acetyl-CoA acyltransferase
MTDAVIVDAVRSPMAKGKVGGALSTLHPVELLSQTIQALFARNDVDPGVVDDVIVGCVGQVGEQAGTVGRQAWLGAGYPEHVPATTIERKCGSSQQALHFAAQGIMAGAYDVTVVGGVESMSIIPLGFNRLGRDFSGPSVAARYAPGLVSQGVSAELVAAKWGISRTELDEYSVRSHLRAHAHAEAGGFGNEIVPITVPTDDGGTRVVDADETIRPNSSVEALANLKVSFEDPEIKARFPQINWSITAGNSSQITDGASALLVMSEERAAQPGLRPRARFQSFAVLGDNPIMMLTAPIPSCQRALERAKMTIDQIDHAEINEAFAPVPIAWQRDLGADPEIVNPCGGAIALGHPLGASGARLMTTMLNNLERIGGRYGIQSMCEGGGMANATIIERL